MDKILAGSARHLEMNGGLRELDYLMLNLPYSCNYKCPKCCNSGRSSGEGETPLSLEEIHRLFADAKGLGIRVLVLAGEGEPLSLPEFKEIIICADSAGLRPYIFTNCSLLDRDMCLFLKRHNASLVINLDSLDKGTYESMSGIKGSFERIMRNLAIAREVFSDCKVESGNGMIRRIALNAVVSQANVRELFMQDAQGTQPMREFCGDDFALVYNTPMPIGRAAGNRDYIPESVAEEIKRSTRGMVPLGTSADGSQCVYMKNGISIGAGGELLVCAYSLESGGLMRNVRMGGLKECVGKANEAVRRFEMKFGHSRCVLRHPKYQELISDMRAKRARKHK